MARPRKYDSEIALQKIMEAFWEHGFESTSLANLVATTGMQKGSLYGAYGDKDSMFQLALFEYDRVAVIGTIAKMEALSGREAIALLLKAPALSVEAGDRRGCLLCNTLGEYSALNEPAQNLADTSRSNLGDAIKSALERMDRSGDQSAKALELLALYFGLRVMARGGVSAAEIRSVGDAALGAL